jgi:hypothetical protein
MRNFKKVSIAAAVTSALGVAGTAQALTLGEPGEALLLPFATCNPATADSSRIDTLIGITVPSRLGGDPTPIGQTLAEGTNGAGYSTAPHVSGYNGGSGVAASIPGGSENIHWYFFDDRSFPILDDGISATPNDYVPFDWCDKVDELDAHGVADGFRGYLVFTNEPEVRTGAGFAMYGDAALVQGNWESAAYLPVVPMADNFNDAGGIQACENEVMQGPSFPSEVNPLCAGMPLDNNNAVADDAVFNVRYFSNPDLNGGTNMVVWLNSNESSRSQLHLEVYDTEEEHNSATVGLPNELNILDPEDIPGTHHTGGDGLKNEGFLQIVLPEVVTQNAAVEGPQTSGVAFALMFFGTDGNANQVQTALAQERGIW